MRERIEAAVSEKLRKIAERLAAGDYVRIRCRPLPSGCRLQAVWFLERHSICTHGQTAVASQCKESHPELMRIARDIAEILGLFEERRFDDLIGTVENSKFDAKAEPYYFAAGESAKHELAKDVSSLANSHGGMIAIGFRTAIDRMASSEYVEECRPFHRSLASIDQYRKILQEWVVPSIPGLRVEWFSTSGDPERGILTLIVPPEAAEHKPFIVTRTVAPDGKVSGTVFGYYERIDDRNVPASAERLRAHFKSGMHNDEVSQRLTALEAALGALTAALESRSGDATVEREGLTEEIVVRRILKAKIALERDGKPNLTLAASSTNSTAFQELFKSRSVPLVQLIEHPPVLRPDGFGIRISRSSEIVKGELRRVIHPGHELLELWKDGLLLAIGPGDYGLLGWAMEHDPERGLPVRNFVLAEVCLEFVRLAVAIFRYAEPAPKALRFRLGIEDMTVNGHPCVLSTGRDNRQRPDFFAQRGTAPESTLISSYEAPFEHIDDGAVTYELLGGLYNQFGFAHSDMPYVDDGGQRITPESLLGEDFQET